MYLRSEMNEIYRTKSALISERPIYKKNFYTPISHINSLPLCKTVLKKV